MAHRRSGQSEFRVLRGSGGWGRLGATRHPGDGFAKEVGVDALAADLVLLAMRVQVVLSFEPPAAEIALELVLGARLVVTNKKKRRKSEISWEYPDRREEGKRTVDACVLNNLAREECLTTHFAWERCGTVKEPK